MRQRSLPYHTILPAAILLWTLLLCPISHAQDTTRHKLTSVTVTSAHMATTTAQTPTQLLTAERMEESGITTLSQAVTQLSGVTLKDYGGVGGMKTISARGLGSQFSTLSIDGIAVTDCQNGQIDLGRYPLSDAQLVGFAQGQFSQNLQSARSLAAGNVLNMETTLPGDTLQGRLSLEAGSFGYLSPTLLLRQRINSHWAYSLWGNRTQSRGNYPFTLHYTVSGQDSTSQERREHSGVEATAMEGNIFWNHDSQDLRIKVRHSQSEHELPGPVVFYSRRGTEYTSSKTTFLQGRYRNAISDRLKLQLMGKYSHVYDTYTDTVTSHNVFNEYTQQEGYLSGTLAYEPLDRLFISLATDEALSSLNSNLARNNDVKRISSQDALSVNFRRPQIDVSANLLLTLVEEHTNDGIQRHYRKLSPYAGLNLNLWHNEEMSRQLRMRLFFKEVYRLPNFNENYYFSLTRDLRPERALQHDIGLSFVSHGSSHTLNMSTDMYFNRVSDKIIAIPTQNLFLWSMLNLGKVNILGIDANADLDMPLFNLHLTYTFQHATDVTDAQSKTYGKQIPYTPRHTGGATFTLLHPIAHLSYSMLLVGDRYNMGDNNANAIVHGYCDQGITLSRSFTLDWGNLNIKAQVLNLLNAQYEVVRNYPMMGRNYRLAIQFDF